MMRRYEGRWARFAQPDPTDDSYDISDPQSLNRYAYTQDDPVNFSDPSGLEENQCDPMTGKGCDGGFWGTLTVGVRDFWAGQFWMDFVLNSRFSGYDPGLREPRPQNKSSNPNCFQNAVVDSKGKPISPGIAAPFDPPTGGPDDILFHNGWHALSAPTVGYAAVLKPLAGTVVDFGGQGDGLSRVYIKPNVGDFYVVYGDLEKVTRTSGRVSAGSIVGTVRASTDVKGTRQSWPLKNIVTQELLVSGSLTLTRKKVRLTAFNEVITTLHLRG
jgi:hypothetical protein